jgi:SWI/SNF-related matrix-associated actin-dependent regulator 1 of chromatin subfamily A
MMKPRPYQEIGIDFLADRQFASLWDEPGLGKSFQTLQAIGKCSYKNVLIICPASVRLVWAVECDKVGFDCNIVLRKDQIVGGINIISYDGASRFKEQIMLHNWDLVVLDEEHYVKNPKAKRTKAIFGDKMDRKTGIASKTHAIWGLTGTPMPNNPSELYPMIRAKFPDAIMKRTGVPMTQWDFIMRYCVTFDNGFGLQITGGKNLTKLRDELRGRVLRRKKEDVAKDLPSMSYEILPVEGNLKSIPEDELVKVQECLKSSEPLEELKKLGTHVASLRRYTGLAKVKSLIKWVEEANHDKIVLFAQHTAVIDELRKMDDTVYIDGTCDPDHRKNAVEQFQNGDAKRFIGQIQAAGTGLTLTAAHTLVFVEYDWTPANNRQAADRIHRIGQENNCLVYFATVPNSIDEDIMKVVKRKTETYKELGL